MSQTMENRKTAEDMLIETYHHASLSARQDILENNIPLSEWDNIQIGWIRHYCLQAMQTFAEQEKEVWSCEFLEWAEGKYEGYTDTTWKDDNGNIFTTAQLYQIFKSERDGK